MLYRAGLLMLALGLFLCCTVAAQQHDTVRVDESADTGVVANGDSTQEAIDTSSGFQTAAVKEQPVLRRVADSTLRDWQADKAYAYANDPDYWRQKVEERRKEDNWFLRALSTKMAEYILLFILGAILLYAIIKIVADNNLRLFYRSPKRKAAADPNKEPSPIEDDLEGMLQHYLQVRDYRQAVRYLYLKTLQLLNERGLIKYHQDATNREYWRQLNETPQGMPFRDLTMIYEKVWYGEFPLADPLFQRLHQYFEDFYKTVRT